MTARRVFTMLRTPVTLLVLLAILLYGAWWGYRTVLTASKPIPPDPCVTVAMSVLKSDAVTVNVFNGSTKRGLAADVAKALRDRQFKIVRISNTDQEVGATVIVGAAAENPEVVLVAKQFKDATVRGDQRPNHTVDVLVGSAFGGFVPDATVSLSVASGQVCLPATPTPTPTPSASVAPTSKPS